MDGRPPLVLASASPRRRALLEQIRQPADVIEAAAVSETPLAGEAPGALAQRLAEAKAACVAVRHGDAFVLGADTVVAVGRRVLGKPRDRGDAEACLRLLSGKSHRVYGGVCVIAPGGVSRSRLVTTRLAFKRLEEREIQAYLESGEWQGKAGAYAIQGVAALYVRHLQGSYSNVVGLPLFETGALLKGLGYGP